MLQAKAAAPSSSEPLPQSQLCGEASEREDALLPRVQAYVRTQG